MSKVTKEHRILDETDLMSIDNTFKLIEKTLASIEQNTNEKINSTNRWIYNLEKTTKQNIENVQKEGLYTRWIISIGFTFLGILMTVLKFL